MIFGSRCTPERIQALAGIAQCAISVDELATAGQTNENTVAHCIEAFFLRTPDELRHYFATPKPVEPGLGYLTTVLGRGAEEDSRRQLRYLFQMQHLSRQVGKRPDMLGVVAAGIDRLEIQRESLDPQDLIRAIGQLYQQTVSKLNFRIQVQGQHGYLRQEQTASAIRAILFCGIRFAYLWRQEGGSQMDFVLRKTQIRELASRLLST